MVNLSPFHPTSYRLLAGVLFASMAILVTSCGGGRKSCYPVSGTILVDGKPAADCMIQFYSADEADHDGPNRVLPLAMADENGKFKISTFESNDGAPAGEYEVTFTWRVRSGLLKNQFDGPDRLKGKYATKELSKIKVMIEKKAQELPTFELTTK